jgi:hypothetical protein
MKRIAAWFMSALLLALSLTGCSAGKTETENRGKSYFTYFDTVSFVYSYAGDSAEQFDRRSAGASGILGEYHRLFDIYMSIPGRIICVRSTGTRAERASRSTVSSLTFSFTRRSFTKRPTAR